MPVNTTDMKNQKKKIMLVSLQDLDVAIRMKYNIARLYVFNLVMHHAAFQRYCLEYQTFLTYIKRNRPYLIALANTKNEPTLI